MTTRDRLRISTVSIGDVTVDDIEIHSAYYPQLGRHITVIQVGYLGDRIEIRLSGDTAHDQLCEAIKVGKLLTDRASRQLADLELPSDVDQVNAALDIDPEPAACRECGEPLAKPGLCRGCARGKVA